MLNYKLCSSTQPKLSNRCVLNLVSHSLLFRYTKPCSIVPCHRSCARQQGPFFLTEYMAGVRAMPCRVPIYALPAPLKNLGNRGSVTLFGGSEEGPLPSPPCLFLCSPMNIAGLNGCSWPYAGKVGQLPTAGHRIDGVLVGSVLLSLQQSVIH